MTRAPTGALRERLGKFPRVGIAVLPTPLETAPRLASAIGVVTLHVKRDDLTGLAFGGNKARQLELIIGSAIASGATALVSTGTAQSNQSRQLAAAAARLGLPLTLVVRGSAAARPDRNDLITRLIGPHVEYVLETSDPGDERAALDRVVAALERAGHRVHVVDVIDHRSEDSVLGAVAYVGAACEILEQLPGREPPTHVAVSCGTGSSPTLAGLVAGFRALGATTRIIGVPAAAARAEVREQTLAIARAVMDRLGMEVALSIADVILADRPSTADTLQAVRIAARTEGLLLDPTYTGPTLAMLIAQARTDDMTSVVLVHTGGTPLLFDPSATAEFT